MTWLLCSSHNSGVDRSITIRRCTKVSCMPCRCGLIFHRLSVDSVCATPALVYCTSFKAPCAPGACRNIIMHTIKAEVIINFINVDWSRSSHMHSTAQPGPELGLSYDSAGTAEPAPRGGSPAPIINDCPRATPLHATASV